MGNPDELQPAWTLILPDGSEWSTLRALVRGLAPEHPLVRVEIKAVPRSVPAPTPRGRLVADAGALSPADLVCLRDFLAASSGWELVLLDRAGLPSLARELVGPSHVSWWPGPLHLEQAKYLLDPPRLRDSAGSPGLEPMPAPAPRAPHLPRVLAPRLAADDEELGAIRAILAGALAADAPSSDGAARELGTAKSERPTPIQPLRKDIHPLELLSRPSNLELAMDFAGSDPSELDELPELSELDDDLPDLAEDLEGDLEDDLDADFGEGPLAPFDAHRTQPDSELDPFAWNGEEWAAPSATSDVPPWYRDQIADLSDLAQRLHLDLFALEEGQGLASSAYMTPLREDVARLTQFTRTLGFLAAPPGPGTQIFSLPTLVQEQMLALAGLGPKAPRFLFKSQQDITVQSDKGAIVGALDAVLQVAGLCAGPHPQTVRVECTPWQGQAQIAVRFAPGPLAGLPIEDIFTPYRLRATLPSIGPNALGASRSILLGQGGSLTLEREGENSYCFFLRLPRVSL